MADVATTTRNKPTWVDLAAKDPAAARDFYSKVFGWDIEVNPDPQYGGYGRAKAGGKDAAGIGGVMSPDAPSAWSVYIGTDDIEALSKQVVDAGGKVVAPAFDIGDQGKMAVFQDPAGAFISAWQAARMGGFQATGRNAFGWAEVNARGVEKVLPFYEQVFGWTLKPSGSPDQPYTEFQVDGESFGGAAEMNPMVPPQVPATGSPTSPSTTSTRRMPRRSSSGPPSSSHRSTSPVAGCPSSATRRARRSACSRSRRADPAGDAARVSPMSVPDGR